MGFGKVFLFSKEGDEACRYFPDFGSSSTTSAVKSFGFSSCPGKDAWPRDLDSISGSHSCKVFALFLYLALLSISQAGIADQNPNSNARF